MYTTKGDYEAAMTDCMEAIRLNPREDNAYNTRGWAHWMRQEVNAAIADYTEAVRLNPSHKKAYANRGFALLGKLDYDKAIVDFTNIVRLDPNDYTGYMCRAFCFGTEEQYDKAIADLDAVIRLRPDWPWPHEMRGAFWVANGNPERGLADFRAMLRLNPKDSAARFEGQGKTAISAANLRHGERQVRQMLHDRPAMASLGKKAILLYQWAARKFAGEDLHEKIYWDSSDPPQHTTADNRPPKPGLPGRIRLAARNTHGPKRGDDRSFEKMWRDVVFELHNIVHAETFRRIDSDAAQGKLSKNEFVTKTIETELRG